MSTKRTALVVGATGLSGRYLIDRLAANNHWRVISLSRGPLLRPGVDQHLAVDLLDAEASMTALRSVYDVTHLFFCIWSRQENEEQNCIVNRRIVQTVLDGLQQAPLSHVALVTGTKHYLGSFDDYAASQVYTPFQEDQRRLSGDNFYYAQEDAIFKAAVERGFTWSVHRPHTMIGHAIGNAMNMAVTLAAYASICKETGRPFLFPGSAQQYHGLCDVTDARLLARHLEWAATTAAAANIAFNVANGDLFRWQWMWAKIANYFALDVADYPGHATPLQQQMADADALWHGIVERHQLMKYPLSRLASWWHSDADLGREIECFNDMARSRRIGFTGYQETRLSFFDVFDRLRVERIIP